jgi:hypothetical protein
MIANNTQGLFRRAPAPAPRAASGGALPNGCFSTGSGATKQGRERSHKTVASSGSVKLRPRWGQPGAQQGERRESTGRRRTGPEAASGAGGRRSGAEAGRPPSREEEGGAAGWAAGGVQRRGAGGGGGAVSS